ncbi:phosphatase PAP2 family protein [Bacteroidota bacterium]
MLELFKRYWLGFIIYLLVFITGIILVITIPKLELHLLMNSSHTSSQDIFFKLITWLGDGWFALYFSLIFLLVRFRYSIMLILSFTISGLLAQLLKRFAFPEVMRPAAFLELMPGLDTVAGVGLYHSLSFPSGHTTTAFAVLLLAGLIVERKLAFILGIILAWCVALSRVYLSQHFLIDVLAGSLLGTLSALFFYWYFHRLKPDWLDSSLIIILPGRKK